METPFLKKWGLREYSVNGYKEKKPESDDLPRSNQTRKSPNRASHPQPHTGNPHGAHAAPLRKKKLRQRRLPAIFVTPGHYT